MWSATLSIGCDGMTKPTDLVLRNNDQQMLTARYFTLKTCLLCLVAGRDCAVAQPHPCRTCGCPERSVSIYHSYEFLPGPAVAPVLSPVTNRFTSAITAVTAAVTIPPRLRACRAARRVAQSRRGR